MERSGPNSTVHLAHTADLDPGSLKAIRALLDNAFGGDIDEHDYEHALGGLHAMVCEEGELVGHGSVIQRRLVHQGRALRTGYVEAVAVRRDRHRRGYGAMAMAALERIIREAYDLGALGANDEGAGFYAARGWKQWQGRSWALTPDGVVRTAEEDDGIYVLQVGAPLHLDGDLTCDWRDGSVW
jgi:aminoglycoside 2'-N-acetyltransferase I